MAFSSQQAVPFGQRLLLRFSHPARRLWRRALLRPIGSAERAGPRAWCLRGAGRVGSRVESHGWLSRRLPRPRRCATLAWGAVGVGGAAERSGVERSGGERSGGLLGMTHAPEVRWHGGSVGVCIGGSQWVLCQCGQLRRRRVALRPAQARSATAPGAGTTPKYMLSAVT